jgi:hypothetical protein
MKEPTKYNIAFGSERIKNNDWFTVSAQGSTTLLCIVRISQVAMHLAECDGRSGDDGGLHSHPEARAPGAQFLAHGATTD